MSQRNRDPMKPYPISIETVVSTAQPIPIPDFLRIKKDPYSSCNCGMGMTSEAAKKLEKALNKDTEINYDPPTVSISDSITSRILSFFFGII